MANFDERSGFVASTTTWGRWWQTVDEVQIEIISDEPITSKDVKCVIKTGYLSCFIKGKSVIEGDLHKAVKADDSTWSIDDKKLVTILLAKANPVPSNLWISLLSFESDTSKEVYAADPWTQNEMQKKLTLERFQQEVASGKRSLDHDDDTDSD